MSKKPENNENDKESLVVESNSDELLTVEKLEEDDFSNC